jgi:hypothetical protein
VGALWSPPNWRTDDEMMRFLNSDDPADRRAIIAGYSLYNREVSFRTIVNILQQFPDRWLAVSSASGNETLFENHHPGNIDRICRAGHGCFRAPLYP